MVAPTDGELAVSKVEQKAYELVDQLDVQRAMKMVAYLEQSLAVMLAFCLADLLGMW
jgi:hypothetical protein